MPSTSRATSVFAANTIFFLAMASSGTAAFDKVEQGCYSSSTPLRSIGTWTYQSSGYCQEQCEKQNAPVFGLSNGNLCWCGSMLPAANTKVDDSNCDTPCQGYPEESCGGGTDYWNIWLTGSETDVPTYRGSGSDSSSSSTKSSPPATSTSTSAPQSTRTHTHRPGRTTAKPSVVTSIAPGRTVVITRPGDAAQSSGAATPSKQADSGSSTNVGAIAAGVVVGVLAVVSIIAGVFFWTRHRRRQQAEEEYKRNQVNDFIRNGERKPPQTGYSSMSDSRLDPEAGNRRNSQGSIADDQDFSRRILRVANPDRSQSYT